MILAAGFAVLIGSRLLLGLFEGPSSALIHTAVYSWHPVEKRALPGALITSTAALSKIVLAPVPNYPVVVYGWRSAFTAMCAAGLVWVALWLTTRSPGPYGAQRTTDPAEDREDDTTSRARWFVIFHTPTFLGALAAAFSFYPLVSVILTWLPSYFEAGLGHSRIEAGTMFGFPSMVALVVLSATAFSGDRLMARASAPGSIGGSCWARACWSAAVTLPLIGTPGLVVAVVSMGYGLGTVVFPLLNAAISEICPKEQLAGTLGVFLALMSSSGIVGRYLPGWIIDRAQSPASGYALTFQFLGVAVVAGAIAVLLTVHPPRDARRVQSALDLTPRGKV
ncbi:MFS transporter [Streptomyces sp. NPDC090499]|uniref:MFS transporter n=1 Tax=Streptomyces sp. NPDC090499 TaxID=3365965 RepID=UPI00380B1A1A